MFCFFFFQPGGGKKRNKRNNLPFPFLPCSGFAASRPSWKELSKFLVSPSGQKSSELLSASAAFVFPAAVQLRRRKARFTHQGLHLQLLHRVWVAPCQSAGDRGEQKHKNAGLHCQVPEKQSCHPVTSVRAAPANGDAGRREAAARLLGRPKWLGGG